MIDNDSDLREFSGVTRLFPLAGCVMFPHVVLPLHIFEPRYRQMTEDALAGDRLMTIIQVRSPEKGKDFTEPVPLEPIGCLGRIIQHERLPDGRFNFLLLGRTRVRIRREVPTGKVYRSAEVDVLNDVASLLPEQAVRAELVALFRQVFERHEQLAPELTELFSNAVPLGVLSDIIAHALSLPPNLKQRMLDETSVDHRANALLAVLRQLVDPNGEHRPFPPRFSPN